MAKVEIKEELNSTGELYTGQIWKSRDSELYILAYLDNKFALISLDDGTTWAGLHDDKITAFGDVPIYFFRGIAEISNGDAE